VVTAVKNILDPAETARVDKSGFPDSVVLVQIGGGASAAAAAAPATEAAVAAPAAAAAVVVESHEERALREMTAMGFGRAEALAALEASGGDVATAVDRIVAKQKAEEAEARRRQVQVRSPRALACERLPRLLCLPLLCMEFGCRRSSPTCLLLPQWS
jgi:hypothetical protein